MLRANCLQAMGHCYRFLGKNSLAIQCLRRAGKVADLVPKGRIFSSVQYRDICTAQIKLKAETEGFLQELTVAAPPE